MATALIKQRIEEYFISNWEATSIQFDGAGFDYSGLDNWISLVYTPAINSMYGFDGTTTGRILSEGVLKVFCYAKSVPFAFQLADSIKLFANGINVDGVEFSIGSDGAALNLSNGLFEVPVTFTTRSWE